jgi:hypothetical protein
MSPVSIVYILSILALLIFGYMRNRQAKRNDKRRERLWKRQDELIDFLQTNTKISNQE